MNECLGVCGRLEVCDPVEADDHPVVGRGRVEVAGRIEEGAVVVLQCVHLPSLVDWSSD